MIWKKEEKKENSAVSVVSIKTQFLKMLSIFYTLLDRYIYFIFYSNIIVNFLFYITSKKFLNLQLIFK